MCEDPLHVFIKSLGHNVHRMPDHHHGGQQLQSPHTISNMKAFQSHHTSVKSHVVEDKRSVKPYDTRHSIKRGPCFEKLLLKCKVNAKLAKLSSPVVAL